MRRAIRALRGPRHEPTEAQGWDAYARAYKSEAGEQLGDEWNRPEVIGLNLAADEVVSYLDRTVSGPLLGTGDVMLETGPGGGRFTEILVNKCRKLIAADTSPAMLTLLKARLSDGAAVEFLRLDGRGLSPIPDASVDSVFSYGVFVSLQHWDIWNYTAEVARVLKPGGKALIHHFNAFSESGWQRFLTEVPMSLNRHKMFGTFTLMTPQIMEEFAHRAGLEMEVCLTDVVPRHCLSLLRRPKESVPCFPGNGNG